MPIAPVFPGPDSGGGGGGTVTAPSPTSQSVAAGGSLSAKTFGAFTDSGGLIDNYVSSVTNASGSASVSGSGLGAYTFGSTADGDSGTLSLTARDASNNPLATATHSFKIAAAAAGGALVSLVDWAGVSYNFLTTGGTGGSGGAGPHTVGGRTWNLTLTGSGPTRLELVSGVLHNESTLANRGTLDTDLGASVGDTSYVIYASADNATRAGAANSLGLFWGTANTVNSNNQGAILLGSASATNLLVRECTGVGSFTTVTNATITDYTTTPTLLGVVVNGGGWTDCHSQGSSTLPTDGGTFGTVGPKQWGEAGAQTIQDRRYLIVQLVFDLDLRLAAHEQRIAP